jgi:hypothetical protein
MRKRLGVVCAALAATVLASCGGGSKATPLELVRGASTETSAAKTARLHMAIETGVAGAPKVEFDGGFNFAEQRARFTLDAASMGIPGATGNIDAVMDFAGTPVQYMRIPGLAEELDGKHWMKVDLGATVRQVCPDIDLEALLSSNSGDPTSGLQTLKGATKVTTVGEEKVRGEDTTHYRVTVDVRRAADNAPESAREAMRKLAAMYTVPTQDLEVWLDGDGRVRRFDQTVDNSTLVLPDCLKTASPGGAPLQGNTHVFYEMFDYGTEVNVKLPAPSDVADLQELMKQNS